MIEHLLLLISLKFFTLTLIKFQLIWLTSFTNISCELELNWTYLISSLLEVFVLSSRLLFHTCMVRLVHQHKCDLVTWSCYHFKFYTLRLPCWFILHSYSQVKSKYLSLLFLSFLVLLLLVLNSLLIFIHLFFIHSSGD